MRKVTRNGDFVTVRLRVVGGDSTGEHGCQVKPGIGVITFVEPDEILFVETTAFAVGDRVTWESKATTFVILALDGEMAWLRNADDAEHHTQYPVKGMVRV